MGKKQRRAIPVYSTPIIETHCHLDYLGVDSLEQIVADAVARNIRAIITIAVAPDNLDTVIALTEASNRVFGTQGIHPHEAEHFNAEVAKRIRDNTAHPRILAVGEIGLDYYYDHADRQVQREAFGAQLALAAEADMPVVIHSREADADMQAILTEYLPQLKRRGVIHSFTSGMALAEFCLDAGFMLGFNGITTFRTAQNVRDVVAITPAEQLLLETDAPYLTPVPYRGITNAPCYLPFIAEHIATLKEMPVEELLAVAYRNSERLFFSANPAAAAALGTLHADPSATAGTTR